MKMAFLCYGWMISWVLLRCVCFSTISPFFWYVTLFVSNCTNTQMDVVCIWIRRRTRHPSEFKEHAPPREPHASVLPSTAHIFLANGKKNRDVKERRNPVPIFVAIVSHQRDFCVSFFGGNVVKCKDDTNNKHQDYYLETDGLNKRLRAIRVEF